MRAFEVIARRARTRFYERVCIHCGAPFAWHGAAKRQCVDCEDARVRARHRAYSKRQYWRRKAERAP